MEFVEEDGDEIFTPMPHRCRKWGCNNAVLELDANGFVVCPVCQGSHGKAGPEWKTELQN